jgi:predicted RecA/RadA family phage recombinase
MQNFIQPGNALTFTAPVGGVVSGGAYLIGALLVVAAVSASAGESFSGARVGVFELPKASGQAWTEGAALYWDNTAKVCTTTSTSNTRIGYATRAAASGATVGAVLLSGY